MSDIYCDSDWSDTKKAILSSSLIQSCLPFILPPPSFATAVVRRGEGGRRNGDESEMLVRIRPEQH